MFLKGRRDAAESDQRQKDLIVSYKQAFGTEAGRSVLYDLMNRYHILNAHKGEVYAEGQRSVVLYLLQQTNVNMQEFEKILKGEA